MWNNNNNSYQYGSTRAPSFPTFPNSGGGNSQSGYSPSYAPSYSSPSPTGPPGSFLQPGASHGYAAPQGPPPGFNPPGPTSGFSPPQGPPPSGYAPPLGPPPFGAPPGGPPPPPNRSNYPGQQYHQQHGSYSQPYGGTPAPMQNAYAAPSGPPLRPPTQEQKFGPVFQSANHQNMQAYFRYSQCTGKRKALCIGINYVGQQGQLAGCINDATNIQKFLCRKHGYKPEDIVMLTDDSRNPVQMPTKVNILRAMQWLVKGASPDDSLFFHYSGHGGQTKDLDGDEADGYDEVIYPLDYKTNGHIVDDLMHEIMVRPLPPGCRLTAIFDSCHSGSTLDLPYIYSTEGKLKEPNLAAEAGQGLLSAVTSYARGDMGGVLKSAMSIVKVATGNTQKAESYAKKTRTSPADVISWSGCKDSQTSADTQEAGQATGAMSFAFISALERNPQQSYQQLLVSVREILRAKYSQKPQLSCSHPMDTNIMFIC
ncbi:hypothetical protein AX17_002276 [Amanita inopinata Kibby_2008]|nr:hypothetical protein AX17_002276 [Amanita inopinata Kibby_2008]